MGKVKAIKRVAVIDFDSMIEKLRKSRDDRWTGFDFYSNEPNSPTEEEIREHKADCDSDIEVIAHFRNKVEEGPAFFRNGDGYPYQINLPQEATDPCRGYRASKHLIFYKTFVYLAEGPHTEEEFILLTCREFERENGFFENLRSSFTETTTEIQEETTNRKRITEKVRHEVWRRDEGKCARCGSREFLEFDHIVPVSKGGSNTARNIELLCEACNRSKGDKLG